jgi:hypothetical protein
MLYQDKMIFMVECCGSAARPEASSLADGIGCCIRMVVRRAAPSSLRMIIRSIVEDARGLDNDMNNRFVKTRSGFTNPR